MIQNCIPDSNSCWSPPMSFNKSLWMAALTGIVSNTNSFTMVSQMWSVIHLKTHHVANWLASLCPHKSIAEAAIDGLSWGGSCIEPSLHAINEADNSTFVAFDQCASNCLEEAVRSFTTMWSRCRSSRTYVAFRSALTFYKFFFAPRSVFPNRHYCKILPLRTSCYCTIGKSSFWKADSNPPCKLRKLKEFLLLPSWRHN